MLEAILDLELRLDSSRRCSGCIYCVARIRLLDGSQGHNLNPRCKLTVVENAIFSLVYSFPENDSDQLHIAIIHSSESYTAVNHLAICNHVKD